MGRRKIEIKAIKDDRNRSVTFLKRKGGLFKKAHELSVLCSVDVAVIIFGHNKRLYEYASGDLNDTIDRFHYVSLAWFTSGTKLMVLQYTENGGAHEHKGPADFNGRQDFDDDDDDDMVPPPEDQTSQEQSLPPHLHNQPTFAHMRQAPSASPPISNGTIPFHQRQHTPQPHMSSRPASRNDVRRQSSNLVQQLQQQVSHAPQVQNGYAYMPNPPIYNQHASQPIPGGPRPVQHPQYPYAHHPQPPQHPQVQQAYLQEQRRQSMPPAFPQQERSQQQQQQQQQQQPRQTPSPPQPESEQASQHLHTQQPKPITVKSRSIFTPIDDSRSLLAQHWGIGTTTTETRNDNVKMEKDSIKKEKDNRSQSVDVGSVQRSNPLVSTTPPAKPQRLPQPQRGQSISSIAGETPGAKRPRLKVQIPSEQSDDGGSATAASSPGGTAGGTPAKASTDASHSSAVVLPPPSPSASALLSAGAQGPPNPFARPHPPMNAANQNNQAYNNNNNIETPISALPSRFVADGLLPSPSSFYPEWGFGRSGGDSNMLPSPLNFQTPVVGNGPSFLRDEDGERKRKSPEGDGQQDLGNAKRVKA